MKILCIIPTYNESSKLTELIDKIKKFQNNIQDVDFLFINNGSTDQSLELIKKSKIDFVNSRHNKGVGYALILGFIIANKNNYEYLIHMAGNGKMDPEDINIFREEIYNNKTDFISGSRFLKTGSAKNNPFYRIILIRGFAFIINFLLKKNITDSTCGFRAIKISIFKNFKKNFLKRKLYTYGYEYFSFGKILKNNKVTFKEVAVKMNYPSKKNYTKIRPIIDWFIILKFWIVGILDKSDL